ncbi:MAG: flagellar hook-basal body complex protein FliE [Acidobacteriaceae bacterium]
MNGMTRIADAGSGLTPPATASSVGRAVAANSSAMPFANVLDAFVAQTNALEAQARQAVTGVLSGQGTDIHTAMIATQKADMAFELALQLRTKAVSAYQQMLNMQF